MDATFTDVGSRISKRIRELGLKQLDVCNKSGLSTTALSQYCTGKRIPDTLSLYKLSIILGVSMEWIFDRGPFTTSEKQPARPLGLDEIKAAQGLTCDGLPLAEDEVDLVAIYRLLPPSHREELFDWPTSNTSASSNRKKNLFIQHTSTRATTAKAAPPRAVKLVTEPPDFFAPL